MRKLNGLICALIVNLALAAEANIIIEPYVGYGTGKWEQKQTGQDLSGMIYGGRLGYGNLGLAGGIEYLAGTLTDESSPELKFKGTNTGVWAGYTFPVLIRVFATYFFDSQSEIEAASFDGTGTKIGFGYTGFPLIHVNIEMMNTDWDTNNSSISTKTKLTLLTFSAPFEF